MEDQKIINFLNDSIYNLDKNLSSYSQIFDNRDMYYELRGHIDDFLNGYVENRFITLAGLRGVGKTTILFQIYNYLINDKKIPKEQVLYLSADDLNSFLGIDIYETINIFLENFHNTRPYGLDKEIFILIDEAHFDKKWSLAGKVFYDKSMKIFFIFTGSSALNFEVNVDAVRRIKKERIFPLSFQEYNKLKNKIPYVLNYKKTINDLIFKNEGIEIAKKLENEMIMDSFNHNIDIKEQWNNYLLVGGFPFGLSLNKKDVYERTFDFVNRIMFKDVLSLNSFNGKTISVISQIITYIALQNPEGTSADKLSGILSKPKKTIQDILNTLEKTHLFFSVKPYGGLKQIKKPWEYYFLSPSIMAALRYRFGNFNQRDNSFLGVLAETYVASYLFKVKEEENYYFNLYYDPRKNGVDFLLDTWDNIIPVEVVYGKKDKKQIKLAINHYKSPYGIIISNTTSKIHQEDNIIYIPLSSLP
ncbi:MAG: AAA family ATPase [Methanobrevibacter sp.]|nr:AAA family ATPase [Candidatus Methanoflexus mossambicus]